MLGLTGREPRVLFVGKYPPIQGGVAADAYKIVCALLSHGASVHVLSDALFAENVHRIFVTFDDIGFLSFSRTKHPGAVDFSLIYPVSDHRRRIPDSDLTESLLYGRALQLAEGRSFDVIVSNYLYPYGLVAARISLDCGLPHVVLHAGSDLFDLAEDTLLASAVIPCLAKASVILTPPSCVERIMAYGARSEMIRCDLNPAPDILALDDLPKEEFPQYFRQVCQAQPFDYDLSRFDSVVGGNVVVGVCGKAGLSKGSMDLLRALSLMGDNSGVAIIAAVAGEGSLHMRQFAKNNGLSSSVLFIPPMPVWRMPSFIRFCDGIACLENGFWLTSHTPQLPIEVIQSGSFGLFSTSVCRYLRSTGVKLDQDVAYEVPEPITPRKIADGFATLVAKRSSRGRNRPAAPRKCYSSAFYELVHSISGRE